MLRNPVGFLHLPSALLLELYDYLCLDQTSSIAFLSKSSNEVVKSPLFWKKKYQRHFPHHYRVLMNQPDNNWHAKFCKIYDEEYENLSVSERRLFSAVKECNIERLREEKIVLSDVEKSDGNNKSLLSWAQQGNQQVLDYFYLIARTSYSIEGGLEDTSKTDEDSRTILYWALVCYQGYEQIRTLLLRGSKLDETYFCVRLTPIHIAAQEGRLDVVRELIENNLELLEQANYNGATPLVFAVARGHIGVAAYLIHKSANLNVNAGNGRTPLHWAAEGGHSQIVAALLRAGATTTVFDSNQDQPIHVAAEEGHLAVVRELIENELELLEQVNDFRETPLLRAAARGHTEVVAYLIDKGANLNVSTHQPNDPLYHGRTPLDWATAGAHRQVLSLLRKPRARHITTQSQPSPIAGGLISLRSNPEEIAVDSDTQVHTLRASSEAKTQTVKILRAASNSFITGASARRSPSPDSQPAPAGHPIPEEKKLKRNFSYSAHFKILAGLAGMLGCVLALVLVPYLAIPIQVSAYLCGAGGLGLFSWGCHEKIKQQRAQHQQSRHNFHL